MSEESEVLNEGEQAVSEENNDLDNSLVDNTPQEVDNNDTESPVSTSEETDEPKQSKSQNAKQRLKRRLREEVRDKEALQKQLEESNKRLGDLEAKVDPLLNPAPPRPDRVDFDSEEAYEDSLFEWRDNTKSVKQEVTQETPQETQEYRPTSDQQEVIDNWTDNCEDAIDKYNDFQEAVLDNNSLPITPMMRDAIMESDVGTDIAYHLSKNVALAGRIAKSSLVGQVREINELAKKFTKSTTNAPAPIETVGKGQASTGSRRDPLLEGATFE